MNFDGASKGNPLTASYGGVVRNSKGFIMGVFWGSIGTSTNNGTELEGMIFGMEWAIQKNWSPIIIEGDSLLIITMAKRLQAGSLEGKLSMNWHLESKLRALCIILEANHGVVFLHVKFYVNKFFDSISNKGVLATSTFLAFSWHDLQN